MTVIVLESVPAGLRGQLTRWLIEVRAGVFVGRLTSRVREKLWELVVREVRDGNAVLVFATPGEQGFGVQSIGDHRRQIVDIEGLSLVRRKAESPG